MITKFSREDARSLVDWAKLNGFTHTIVNMASVWRKRGEKFTTKEMVNKMYQDEQSKK